MLGLLALALVALAVALALGYAIATWWLRPTRLSSPDTPARSVRTTKG